MRPKERGAEGSQKAGFTVDKTRVVAVGGPHCPGGLAETY